MRYQWTSRQRVYDWSAARIGSWCVGCLHSTVSGVVYKQTYITRVQGQWDAIARVAHLGKGATARDVADIGTARGKLHKIARDRWEIEIAVAPPLVERERVKLSQGRNLNVGIVVLSRVYC